MSTLQLGCGMRPLAGAINHDRTAHSAHVDIAHDLNILPWPWADATFKKVVALDVLEHLKVDVDVWLNECWRILVERGQLVLRLPAWDNAASYRDTTHRKVFHAESFDFWDQRSPWHQTYGWFYYQEAGCWWEKVLVETVNQGDLGFVLRKVPRG